MLFNSYIFLLAFLPVTALGFFLIGKRSQLLAACWLAAASLFFYGWWDVRYLPLLLASITVNYCCSLFLQPGRSGHRRLILIGALCANLALLIYYKYAGFSPPASAN